MGSANQGTEEFNSTLLPGGDGDDLWVCGSQPTFFHCGNMGACGYRGSCGTPKSSAGKEMMTPRRSLRRQDDLHIDPEERWQLGSRRRSSLPRPVEVVPIRRGPKPTEIPHLAACLAPPIRRRVDFLARRRDLWRTTKRTRRWYAWHVRLPRNRLHQRPVALS